LTPCSEVLRQIFFWWWPGNSNYELGRGDQRSSWKPRPVPAVEKTHLLQVACGGFHTAALTGTPQYLCVISSAVPRMTRHLVVVA